MHLAEEQLGFEAGVFPELHEHLCHEALKRHPWTKKTPNGISLPSTNFRAVVQFEEESAVVHAGPHEHRHHPPADDDGHRPRPERHEARPRGPAAGREGRADRERIPRRHTPAAVASVHGARRRQATPAAVLVEAIAGPRAGKLKAVGALGHHHGLARMARVLSELGVRH